MRNRLVLVCTLLALTAGTVLAQDSEPGGIWSSITVEKKINKKIDVGTEWEFRTNGLSLERDRIAIQLYGDYEIIKNLKIGASYTYLNVMDDYRFSIDSIRLHYQNRHRTHLQLGYKISFDRFDLQFRERAQLTFRDESDRLREDGSINENRINPDFLWRNRIKLAYNIKGLPLNPSISAESYYLFNDPEDVKIFDDNGIETGTTNSYFSKLRYTLALEYKINKRNSVELFGILSNERGAEEVAVPGPNYYELSNWTSDYILGLSYKLSL